jgi:hypothetical protein
MTRPLYGLMAEFTRADDLLDAVRRARSGGYRDIEAYAPFAVEGLPEALGAPPSRVPLATLLGGLAGGLAGYGLQWYAAAVDLPLNIGGRPLHSWPMFIPIAFETTVLCAAFAAVIAMLWGNGLPRLNHPVFDAPDFGLASRSRFFLCLRCPRPAGDPHTENMRDFLAELNPVAVNEVPLYDVPRPEMPRSGSARSEMPRSEVPGSEVPQSEVRRSEVPQ